MNGGTVSAGAALVDAACTVLGDVAMVIGAMVLLAAFLLALSLLIALGAGRKRPLRVVIAPPVPDPIDDAVGMLAQWRDDKVTAELEAIISEGGGRG